MEQNRLLSRRCHGPPAAVFTTRAGSRSRGGLCVADYPRPGWLRTQPVRAAPIRLGRTCMRRILGLFSVLVLCGAIAWDLANDEFWARHALFTGLVASFVVVGVTAAVLNRRSSAGSVSVGGSGSRPFPRYCRYALEWTRTTTGKPPHKASTAYKDGRCCCSVRIVQIEPFRGGIGPIWTGECRHGVATRNRAIATPD